MRHGTRKLVNDAKREFAGSVPFGNSPVPIEAGQLYLPLSNNGLSQSGLAAWLAGGQSYLPVYVLALKSGFNVGLIQDDQGPNAKRNSEYNTWRTKRDHGDDAGGHATGKRFSS